MPQRRDEDLRQRDGTDRFVTKTLDHARVAETEPAPQPQQMDVQTASWIEWVDGRIEQMRDFILDTVGGAFGELLDKEHARAAGVVRKVLVATLMPDGFSRARSEVFPSHAGGQSRTRYQSEYGKGTRAQFPNHFARPRRRGDRMSYAPAFVHIARQRINGPELPARIRDEPVEEGAAPFELRDRDVLKYALLYERGAFLVRHSWLPLRADDQYRSHVAIDLKLCFVFLLLPGSGHSAAEKKSRVPPAFTASHSSIC